MKNIWLSSICKLHHHHKRPRGRKHLQPHQFLYCLLSAFITCQNLLGPYPHYSFFMAVRLGLCKQVAYANWGYSTITAYTTSSVFISNVLSSTVQFTFTVRSTRSKNLSLPDVFIGSITLFDNFQAILTLSIKSSAQHYDQAWCHDDQLKTWLRMVKQDAELIVSPHLYGVRRWSHEWLALIIEAVLNHHAWSSNVQDMVNLLEIAGPTDPG